MSATVTFSAGSSVGSKQCVCVSIIDDVKLEETEQFFVSLTTLQPCIGIENDFDVATIMITDNERKECGNIVCHCVVNYSIDH